MSDEQTSGVRVASSALLGGTCTDAPMFDFELIYVARNKDPYYVTRWDLAKPISVRAHTLEQAIDSAKAALGEPGRYHQWLFEVRKMTDSRIADSLRVSPNTAVSRPPENDK